MCSNCKALTQAVLSAYLNFDSADFIVLLSGDMAYMNYIRHNFLSELKAANVIERLSTETCNREVDAKTWENDLNKEPVCLTKEQLQTTGEERSEKDSPSENAKTSQNDENHVTNRLSPSQSENYPAPRFAELQNTVYNQRNSTLKSSPLCEIDCNNNKPIWRPWWEDVSLN